MPAGNALKTVALVPAKRLGGAKSRLAGALGEAERAELTLDMLREVLRQLAQVRGLTGWAVVTADDDAVAITRQLGGEIVVETSEGLNVALDAGRAWAHTQGAEALLVVLSDLPLVQAADLDTVIDAGMHSPVAIAPSQDGGTNVMLLRPPDAIPFRFGRDSARYHRYEAGKRGLEVAVIQRDSLAFDVDTAVDLAAYRQTVQRALA
jgi:2-phospho-L-lactate guanylyltransferase